jgi:hypothetical protein
VLKDLSYNAGFDSDFTLTNAVTMFAEYSYERYYKAMASRYRVPGGAAPLPPANPASEGAHRRPARKRPRL